MLYQLASFMCQAETWIPECHNVLIIVNWIIILPLPLMNSLIKTEAAIFCLNLVDVSGKSLYYI